MQIKWLIGVVVVLVVAGGVYYMWTEQAQAPTAAPGTTQGAVSATSTPAQSQPAAELTAEEAAKMDNPVETW